MAPSGLTSEQVIRIEGLDAVYQGATFDDLLTCGAMEILIDGSEGALKRTNLSDRDREPLIAVLYELDGNPFALACAAKSLKVYSPKSLLHRLEDRFDIFRTAGEGTLRSRFDARYHRLNQPAKDLLKHLSFFQGAFSLDRVFQVAGNYWTSIDEISSALSDLLDDGWCHPLIVELDERMFYLPNNNRLYCQLQLSKSEISKLGKEHFTWLRANVNVLLSRIGSLETRDDIQYLDVMYREIRGVLLQLLKSSSTVHEAGDLILQFHQFWFARDYLDEGMDCVLSFLDSKEAVSYPGYVRITLLASYISSKRGDYSASLRWSLESLRVSRKTGNELFVAKSLGAISTALEVKNPRQSWRFGLRAIQRQIKLQVFDGAYRNIANLLGAVPPEIENHVVDQLFCTAVQIESQGFSSLSRLTLRNNMSIYYGTRGIHGRSRHLALVTLDMAVDLQSDPMIATALRTCAECFSYTNSEVAALFLGASTCHDVDSSESGQLEKQNIRGLLRKSRSVQELSAKEFEGTMMDLNALSELARGMELTQE